MRAAPRYYIRLVPQCEGTRQYFAGPLDSRSEAYGAVAKIRAQETYATVSVDPKPLSHTAARRAGMRAYRYGDETDNLLGGRLAHDPLDIAEYTGKGEDYL